MQMKIFSVISWLFWRKPLNLSLFAKPLFIFESIHVIFILVRSLIDRCQIMTDDYLKMFQSLLASILNPI